MAQASLLKTDNLDHDTWYISTYLDIAALTGELIALLAQSSGNHPFVVVLSSDVLALTTASQESSQSALLYLLYCQTIQGILDEAWYILVG